MTDRQRLQLSNQVPSNQSRKKQKTNGRSSMMSLKGLEKSLSQGKIMWKLWQNSDMLVSSSWYIHVSIHDYDHYTKWLRSAPIIAAGDYVTTVTGLITTKHCITVCGEISAKSSQKLFFLFSTHKKKIHSDQVNMGF